MVIAYIFTVIDPFTSDLTNGNIHANGQAIGSLWIWLLPIAVGRLQISPKCDSILLGRAVGRANEIAHVAGTNEPTLASDTTRGSKYAISVALGTRDPMRCDEECTVPVHNYARSLFWVQDVEAVASAFDAASEKACNNEPVKGGGAGFLDS